MSANDRVLKGTVLYYSTRGDDTLVFPGGLTEGEVDFVADNITRRRNGDLTDEVFEALLEFLADQGVRLYEEEYYGG